MEGLNLALIKARDQGIIIGVNVGNGGFNLSHMFFADDAVFIGEWSYNNIMNVARILKCFSKVAGLKVNMNKSCLYGIGVTPVMVEDMSGMVGCKAGSFPAVFLGVPIGTNMKLKKSWDPLLDKFRKRLSKWKASTLSFGGRSTLVKSVLGNLGTYWFSLFKAPVTVIEEMEGIRRDFFWGKRKDHSAIPWVKWEVACASFENGGIELGNLEFINMALVSKWGWRFKAEPESMWVKIIKSLHGSHGLFCLDGWKVAKSSLWKNITGNIQEMKLKGVDLMDKIRFQVGDGKDTLFWYDLWNQDKSLKSRFPFLFAIFENKEATIADVLQKMGSVEQWKARLGGGRTAAAWMELLNQIGDIRLEDKRDKVAVSGSDLEEFSVSWCRELIVKKLQRRDDTSTIWNNWIPRKSNILFWRIRRKRVPVRDNLKKMKIDVPDTKCQICGREEETVHHLFFHCSFAMSIWDNLWRWWNVEPHPFDSFEEMDEWIDNKGFNGRKAKCIYASVIAACQAIWEARNGLIFRNVNPSVVAYSRKFKEDLLVWLRNRSNKIQIDSVGWYITPKLSFV